MAETVDRAALVVPRERMRVLTGQDLVRPLLEALPQLDREMLMVEPQARGTGPVLAWAAWDVHRSDPEAVIVSLHADHVIRPSDAFVDLLSEAVSVARREEALVTVAVPPTRPESGYGYIEPGEALRCSPGHRAFGVASFREKPSRATAEKYIADGHFWNSGIFVWKASVFLEEIRAVAPEIGDLLPLLEEGGVEEFFAQAPVVTVDVAVLERSRRVAAMVATFEWDDVGSWEALARTRSPDEAGNVVVGPAHTVDSSGNIVYSEDGIVIMYGVENLVVVHCGGTTLVTRRDLAPKLKELLAAIPGSVGGGD